jgi:hypothetical protein
MEYERTARGRVSDSAATCCAATSRAAQSRARLGSASHGKV